MKIAAARKLNSACCMWALQGILYDIGSIPTPTASREEMLEAGRRVREADRFQVVGETQRFGVVVDESVVDRIVAYREAVAGGVAT